MTLKLFQRLLKMFSTFKLDYSSHLCSYRIQFTESKYINIIDPKITNAADKKIDCISSSAVVIPRWRSSSIRGKFAQLAQMVQSGDVDMAIATESMYLSDELAAVPCHLGAQRGGAPRSFADRLPATVDG